MIHPFDATVEIPVVGRAPRLPRDEVRFQGPKGRMQWTTDAPKRGRRERPPYNRQRKSFISRAASSRVTRGSYPKSRDAAALLPAMSW